MAEHTLHGRLHDALSRLPGHVAEVDAAAHASAAEYQAQRARERANADNQTLPPTGAAPTDGGIHP